MPGAAWVGHNARLSCVESLHRCAAHLARTPTTATTGTKGTSTMAPTDYDAPRRTESDDVAEDSWDELKERRNDAAAAVIDVDETDTAESFELPGADLSGEELSVRVVPNKPMSSAARPASWSSTVTATPGNAQGCRSAATARHNRGPRVARTDWHPGWAPASSRVPSVECCCCWLHRRCGVVLDSAPYLPCSLGPGQAHHQVQGHVDTG